MTAEAMAVQQQLRVLCNGVTDYTRDGKCSCCGQCCSNFLPLTAAEVRYIHMVIKRRKLKPHTRHAVPDISVYDATCPFLDGDNRCSIYNDRPFICRSFICSKKARDYLAPEEQRWYAQHPRTVAMREEFFGGG